MNKNIILVIMIIILVGTVGYFALVRKPETLPVTPTSTLAPAPTPTPATTLLFISDRIDPVSGKVRGDTFKIDLEKMQVVKEDNIFSVLPSLIKNREPRAWSAQLNQQERLFTYGFGDGIHLYNLESGLDDLILKNDKLADYGFQYPTLSIDGNYVVAYQAFFDPNDERHYRIPVIYQLNIDKTIPIKNIKENIIGVPRTRIDAVWSKTLTGTLFISQANLLENFVVKITDKNDFEVIQVLQNKVTLSQDAKVNCLFDVSALGDISPDGKFIARLCNDDGGRDYLIIQDFMSQKVISFKNIYELTDALPLRYYNTSENLQWLSNNILGFRSTLYEKQTDYSRSIIDRLMIVFVEDDGKLEKIERLEF